MHLFDAATRFFGGNAIVAGGLPLAVGLALADKMAGRSDVTVCFFGEGAVAEGEFHESLNLAALWQLPVLFCCENNLYAMGTALARSESQTDIALKAAALRDPRLGGGRHGRPGCRGGCPPRVDAVRSGGGPHFLELRTYRFRAHSMFDPERYRTKEEVARWMERDPITLLRTALEAAGQLSAAEWEQLQADAQAESRGRRRLRRGRNPGTGGRTDPLCLQRARRRRGRGHSNPPGTADGACREGSRHAMKSSYREALRAGIRDALIRDLPIQLLLRRDHLAEHPLRLDSRPIEPNTRRHRLGARRRRLVPRQRRRQRIQQSSTLGRQVAPAGSGKDCNFVASCSYRSCHRSSPGLGFGLNTCCIQKQATAEFGASSARCSSADAPSGSLITGADRLNTFRPSDPARSGCASPRMQTQST